MRKLIGDETKRYRKRYPTTLFKAIENQNNLGLTFQMLRKKREKTWVEDYEGGKTLSMEVLGPVGVRDEQDNLCLKFFTNNGKTKNGHSVSLMLRIGKLNVFLGGDLNIEAENYLLEHYTKKSPAKIRKRISKETDPAKLKKLNEELDEIIEKGRAIYEADIAKACHHGSHHFTTEFLKCINAIATVVSSGDNESHGHPRPDALGSFGKYGRGERPLIFSTELARSHKEIIKKPFQFKRSINFYTRAIDKETNAEKKEKLQRKLDKVLEKIERTVAVYGMIAVRTDGERVMICQKLEKARSAGSKWDIHELIYDKEKKEFEYHIKLNH